MCNIYCMSVTISVLTMRMIMKTHQASNVSVHYHRLTVDVYKWGEHYRLLWRSQCLGEKEAISQSIDFSHV